MRSILQFDGQVITAETEAPIHDAPRLEGKGRFLHPPGSAVLAAAHNGIGVSMGIEKGRCGGFTGLLLSLQGFSTLLLALEVTFPEALGLGFRLLVTILLVMTDERFLHPLFQLFEDSA